MHTIATKKEDFKTGKYVRRWLLIDADQQTLGRLASKIAAILRGKHRPYFSPHVDCGDYVVVINASKIKLSGNKLEDKQYYYHTGYIGGIKQESAKAKMARKPTEVLYLAVKQMMPRNALNRQSLNKLKIYPLAEHPHQANKLQPMSIEHITRYNS